jgi:hypothetical protein
VLHVAHVRDYLQVICAAPERVHEPVLYLAVEVFVLHLDVSMGLCFTWRWMEVVWIFVG